VLHIFVLFFRNYPSFQGVAFFGNYFHGLIALDLFWKLAISLFITVEASL